MFRNENGKTLEIMCFKNSYFDLVNTYTENDRVPNPLKPQGYIGTWTVKMYPFKLVKKGLIFVNVW